ncbi:MAG: hypothetical protein M0R51_11675 [Clostridia bacterium]|jgi:hypothetical protein|nr:hypothetical protein [Clostridia bacterium]
MKDLKVQKFHKNDHVMIAKDLGKQMAHFPSGIDAVVIGSYNDQFGSGDIENYTLYVNGHGEVSWYEEWQLTLIDNNGEKLIENWKNKEKVIANRESDINWIFKHGKYVLSHASGYSIESLAACIGMTNMWGSKGEGFVYYENAMYLLSLAKTFLENGDRIGWLSFCDNIKENKPQNTNYIGDKNADK